MKHFYIIYLMESTQPTKEKCCEIGCDIITNKNDMKCTSCKRELCQKCYNDTIERAKNNPFYVQYKSYCDTCIWFDMG